MLQAGIGSSTVVKLAEAGPNVNSPRIFLGRVSALQLSVSDERGWHLSITLTTRHLEPPINPRRLFWNGDGLRFALRSTASHLASRFPEYFPGNPPGAGQIAISVDLTAAFKPVKPTRLCRAGREDGRYAGCRARHTFIRPIRDWKHALIRVNEPDLSVSPERGPKHRPRSIGPRALQGGLAK